MLLSNSKPALVQMLKICDAHAMENRYRYNVAKCEVLSSVPSGRLENISLHGQKVPLSETFTYLGCAFTSNGILWEKHFDRMSAKALTATNMLSSVGCNGRSIGVGASLAIFRTFVRPVLEYGLALCPPSGMKKLEKTYGKCIRWISSSGTGAAADVIGLFGNMETLEARRERLGSRFSKRVRELGESEAHYAIVDAQRAHNSKSVPGSIFKNLKELPLVKTWQSARNTARLTMQESGAGPLTWKDRREELMDAVSIDYITGFIFGGLDADSRKETTKAFRKLSPNEQNAIFLWCLNRAAGQWKICRNCRAAAGTKAHLEECILHMTGRPAGPSLLEDMILEARTSTTELARIAAQIRRCIGDKPLGSIRAPDGQDD